MTDTLHPIRMRGEAFAADIPPELAAADKALTDYGRWATLRASRGAPGTMDRQYRREADRTESLEAYQRRRAYVPRDAIMPTAEALKVQHALAEVPERERQVLAILYVPDRLPVAVHLRWARIPPALCRERHRVGLRMFAKIYQP